MESKNKYFIYHQHGVVKVIAESDLPSPFTAIDLESIDKLKNDLSTKGITVENGFFAIRLVLNHAGIALPESDETLFHDTERYFKDNKMYPIPSGWTVMILCERKECYEKGMVCIYQRGRVVPRCYQFATLAPIEKPEPVKEEDQDFDNELRRLADYEKKSYLDSDFDYEWRINRFIDAIIPILKSKFTITRKN